MNMIVHLQTFDRVPGACLHTSVAQVKNVCRALLRTHLLKVVRRVDCSWPAALKSRPSFTQISIGLCTAGLPADPEPTPSFACTDKLSSVSPLASYLAFSLPLSPRSAAAKCAVYTHPLTRLWRSSRAFFSRAVIWGTAVKGVSPSNGSTGVKDAMSSSSRTLP